MESAVHADLLLHVVDVSSPVRHSQIDEVNKVLREIEAARLDEERKQAIRAADDEPKGKSDEPPPPPWMQ